MSGPFQRHAAQAVADLRAEQDFRHSLRRRANTRRIASYMPPRMFALAVILVALVMSMAGTYAGLAVLGAAGVMP